MVITHTCAICGNLYKFQSGLSRHMNSHKPEFKVRCNCGSVFSRSDNLKRHQFKCNGGSSALVSDDKCVVMTSMNSDTCIESEKGEPPHLMEVSKNAELLTPINTRREIDTQTDEVTISDIPKVA